MIARIWHGATRKEDRDAYLRYLRRTGLRAFAKTPGNRGAFVLVRHEGPLAEFTVVSLWDSLQDVRGFAGPKPERAVFYPEDQRFLVEADSTVRHHDVHDAEWPTDPTRVVVGVRGLA